MWLIAGFRFKMRTAFIGLFQVPRRDEKNLSDSILIASPKILRDCFPEFCKSNARAPYVDLHLASPRKDLAGFDYL